jgi:hypothetical protein
MNSANRMLWFTDPRDAGMAQLSLLQGIQAPGTTSSNCGRRIMEDCSIIGNRCFIESAEGTEISPDTSLQTSPPPASW